MAGATNHTYRPEIDGLRAIAVLSVILFHAGAPGVSGGFVGVDIFFVISGFLITQIILADLQHGRFSLTGFYERRARRILPALLAVIASSAGAAWLWMTPAEFSDFTASAIAALLFVPNVYFWREAGYFDALEATKPLLHTWTLGVEEQFYWLMPLVLLGLFRVVRPHVVLSLALMGVASFLLCILWGTKHPSANFYLLPTRAWELLVGALLAARPLTPHQQRWREAASVAGLGAIVGAVVLLSKATPFPSAYALLPTLGAALLIIGGGDTIIGRLLSWRPVVGVGLISYSLYLWHQPVFVFARLYALDPLTELETLGLLTLLFPLAYLSYRHIEQPFRNRSRISTKAVWSFAVAAPTALAALLVVGLAIGGPNQSTFEQQFAEPLKSKGVRDDKGALCANRSPETACRFAAKAGQPTWAIVGDSHARMLSTPLWERLRPTGAGFVELTQGACIYAPGLDLLIDGQASDCTAAYNEKRQRVLLALPPSVVVLHMRLPLFVAGGAGFDNQEGGVEKMAATYVLARGTAPLADAGERQEAIRAAMVGAIQELRDHGHTVVLVYPVPEAGWFVRHRVAKLLRRGASLDTIISWVSTNHPVVQTRLRDSYAGTTTTSSASTLNSCCAGRGKQGVAKP